MLMKEKSEENTKEMMKKLEEITKIRNAKN